MVEAPDNNAAVAALNRARDMAAHQEQGYSRLVFSLDGYVYECMSGIADSAVDLEPQPQREHPNSQIGFAVTDSEGQRSAILRRLDLAGTSHPEQVVFHRAEDGSVVATRMPGVLAGIAPQHPWQVVHAGVNRFVVGAGSIFNRGKSRKSPAQRYDIAQSEIFTGDSWLCLEADWKIDSQSSYTLRAPPRLRTVGDLNGSLQLTYDKDGEPHWRSGTCRYPIARLRQASIVGERPLISQTRVTDFYFGGGGHFAGPFGPSPLPF